MSGSAASATSKRRRLSQMSLHEYVDYVQHEKQLTVSDRNNQLKSLDAMVVKLLSDDKEEQLETIRQYRNLLSDPDPPFQQIMQTNAYSHFVDLLGINSSPIVQFEAMNIIGILLNSCIRSSELELQRVGQNLVNLIGGPYLTKHQAMKTIARFTLRSPEDRYVLVQCGCIEKLVGIYYTDETDSLDPELPTLLVAIDTVCSEQLEVDRSIQVFRLVHEILRKCNDKHIKELGSWILCKILPKDGSSTQPYRDISVPFFLNLIKLMGDTTSVVLPNVIMIEKISAYSLRLAEMMAQPEPLSRLLLLVVHKDSIRIKLAACKTICQIARQSDVRTQAVVAAGLVPALHHVFRASKDSMLREEAAKTLVTLLYSSTPDDCRGICGYCIEPLTCLLEHSVFDLICLEAMEKLLLVFEEGGAKHGLALQLRILEDLGVVNILKKFISCSGELQFIASAIIEQHFSHITV